MSVSNNENEKKYNPTLIFEAFGTIGIIATVVALMLGSMFYLASKIDNFREEMQTEIRDFHGRLCAIEERNKK